MQRVHAKMMDNRFLTILTDFNIGDYVKVVESGHQYSAFTNAFIYFWGNIKCHHLTEEDKKAHWKVINMALHPNGVTVLYHIRDVSGKNVVVNSCAIKRDNFHKRNRTNIKEMVIYQIPTSTSITQEHTWKDKLWEYVNKIEK